MIEAAKSVSPHNRQVKAVGLLSGGLDSTLAVKIIKDLGIEIHALYFAMPWGCCNKTKAMEVALKLGIKLVVLQLDERYLEIVEKPKYGYGTALNPCRDCRIHMFSRAQKYMESINADFVFTGEVLGQRPMSQMRESMAIIERGSNLEGRLLRPLCAQLLEATIPEQQGVVDRQKLLALSGRSRKEQINLANQFGITDYLPPAGGCLLTDKNFARRMQDTFKYGYRNFRETIGLKWGRHFRLSENFKAVLGRDEAENESLKAFAHQDDYVMELPDKIGPTLILKGLNPDQESSATTSQLSREAEIPWRNQSIYFPIRQEIFAQAAGLIQRFSRHKGGEPVTVHCWPVKNPNDVREILSNILTEEFIEQIKI